MSYIEVPLTLILNFMLSPWNTAAILTLVEGGTFFWIKDRSDATITETELEAVAREERR